MLGAARRRRNQLGLWAFPLRRPLHHLPSHLIHAPLSYLKPRNTIVSLLLCSRQSNSKSCPAPVRCRDLARPGNDCSPSLTTITPAVRHTLKPLCSEKHCEGQSETSKRFLTHRRSFSMATLTDLPVEIKMIICEYLTGSPSLLALALACRDIPLCVIDVSNGNRVIDLRSGDA